MAALLAMAAEESPSDFMVAFLAVLAVVQTVILAWLAAGPARARSGRDRRG
jgi:hypothetical protein